MLQGGEIIIVKRGGGDGSRRYPLKSGSASIGRATENDIRVLLPDVAAHHALIEVKGDVCVIKNLSHNHSTLVNGIAVQGEHTLNHNDIITLGERSVRWEYFKPKNQDLNVGRQVAVVRPLRRSDIGSTEISKRTTKLTTKPHRPFRRSAGDRRISNPRVSAGRRSARNTPVIVKSTPNVLKTVTSAAKKIAVEKIEEPSNMDASKKAALMILTGRSPARMLKTPYNTPAKKSSPLKNTFKTITSHPKITPTTTKTVATPKLRSTIKTPISRKVTTPRNTTTPLTMPRNTPARQTTPKVSLSSRVTPKAAILNRATPKVAIPGQSPKVEIPSKAPIVKISPQTTPKKTLTRQASTPRSVNKTTKLDTRRISSPLPMKAAKTELGVINPSTAHVETSVTEEQKRSATPTQRRSRSAPELPSLPPFSPNKSALKTTSSPRKNTNIKFELPRSPRKSLRSDLLVAHLELAQAVPDPFKENARTPSPKLGLPIQQLCQKERTPERRISASSNEGIRLRLSESPPQRSNNQYINEETVGSSTSFRRAFRSALIEQALETSVNTPNKIEAARKRSISAENNSPRQQPSPKTMRRTKSGSQDRSSDSPARKSRSPRKSNPESSSLDIMSKSGAGDQPVESPLRKKSFIPTNEYNLGSSTSIRKTSRIAMIKHALEKSSNTPDETGEAAPKRARSAESLSSKQQPSPKCIRVPESGAGNKAEHSLARIMPSASPNSSRSPRKLLSMSPASSPVKARTRRSKSVGSSKTPASTRKSRKKVSIPVRSPRRSNADSTLQLSLSQDESSASLNSVASPDNGGTRSLKTPASFRKSRTQDSFVDLVSTQENITISDTSLSNYETTGYTSRDSSLTASTPLRRSVNKSLMKAATLSSAIKSGMKLPQIALHSRMSLSTVSINDSTLAPELSLQTPSHSPVKRQTSTPKPTSLGGLGNSSRTSNTRKESNSLAGKSSSASPNKSVSLSSRKRKSNVSLDNIATPDISEKKYHLSNRSQTISPAKHKNILISSNSVVASPNKSHSKKSPEKNYETSEKKSSKSPGSTSQLRTRASRASLLSSQANVNTSTVKLRVSSVKTPKFSPGTPKSRVIMPKSANSRAYSSTKPGKSPSESLSNSLSFQKDITMSETPKHGVATRDSLTATHGERSPKRQKSSATSLGADNMKSPTGSPRSPPRKESTTKLAGNRSRSARSVSQTPNKVSKSLIYVPESPSPTKNSNEGRSSKAKTPVKITQSATKKLILPKTKTPKLTPTLPKTRSGKKRLSEDPINKPLINAEAGPASSNSARKSGTNRTSSNPKTPMSRSLLNTPNSVRKSDKTPKTAVVSAKSANNSAKWMNTQKSPIMSPKSVRKSTVNDSLISPKSPVSSPKSANKSAVNKSINDPRSSLMSPKSARKSKVNESLNRSKSRKSLVSSPNSANKSGVKKLINVSRSSSITPKSARKRLVNEAISSTTSLGLSPKSRNKSAVKKTINAPKSPLMSPKSAKKGTINESLSSPKSLVRSPKSANKSANKKSINVLRVSSITPKSARNSTVNKSLSSPNLLAFSPKSGNKSAVKESINVPKSPLMSPKSTRNSTVNESLTNPKSPVRPKSASKSAAKKSKTVPRTSLVSPKSARKSTVNKSLSSPKSAYKSTVKNHQSSSITPKSAKKSTVNVALSSFSSLRLSPQAANKSTVKKSINAPKSPLTSPKSARKSRLNESLSSPELPKSLVSSPKSANKSAVQKSPKSSRKSAADKLANTPKSSAKSPKSIISQNNLISPITSNTTINKKAKNSMINISPFSSPKRASISQSTSRHTKSPSEKNESPEKNVRNSPVKKVATPKSKEVSSAKRRSQNKSTPILNVTALSGFITPENSQSPVDQGTPVLHIETLLNSSVKDKIKQFESLSAKRSSDGTRKVSRSTLGAIGERILKRKSQIEESEKRVKTEPRKLKGVSKIKKSGTLNKSAIKKVATRYSNQSDKTDENAPNTSADDIQTPKSSVALLPEVLKEKHSTAKKPVSRKTIIDSLNESNEIMKNFFSSPVKRKLSQSMRLYDIVLSDDEDKGNSSRKSFFRKTPNVSFDLDSLRTPKVPTEMFVSPLEISNYSGVKSLFRKSPKNELIGLSGVKKLVKTPGAKKSPRNDLSKVTGVKALFNANKSPQNDLTNVAGVKRLFESNKKRTKERNPENDLTNIAGVKKLLQTPDRKRKSPKNDLSNISGVRKLVQTPGRKQKSPNNDLTNIPNVRSLFSPKAIRSPKNTLENISGIGSLFDGSSMLDKSEILFNELLGVKVKKKYSKSFSSAQKSNDRSNRKSQSFMEEWLEQEIEKRLSGQSSSVNRSPKCTPTKPSKEMKNLTIDMVGGSDSNLSRGLRHSSRNDTNLPLKKRSLPGSVENALPLKKRSLINQDAIGHSTPVKGPKKLVQRQPSYELPVSPISRSPAASPSRFSKTGSPNRKVENLASASNSNSLALTPALVITKASPIAKKTKGRKNALANSKIDSSIEASKNDSRPTRARRQVTVKPKSPPKPKTTRGKVANIKQSPTAAKSNQSPVKDTHSPIKTRKRAGKKNASPNKNEAKAPETQVDKTISPKQSPPLVKQGGSRGRANAKQLEKVIDASVTQETVKSPRGRPRKIVVSPAKKLSTGRRRGKKILSPAKTTSPAKSPPKSLISEPASESNSVDPAPVKSPRGRPRRKIESPARKTALPLKSVESVPPNSPRGRPRKKVLSPVKTKSVDSEPAKGRSRKMVMSPKNTESPGRKSETKSVESQPPKGRPRKKVTSPKNTESPERKVETKPVESESPKSPRGRPRKKVLSPVKTEPTKAPKGKPRKKVTSSPTKLDSPKRKAISKTSQTRSEESEREPSPKGRPRKKVLPAPKPSPPEQQERMERKRSRRHSQSPEILSPLKTRRGKAEKTQNKVKKQVSFADEAPRNVKDDSPKRKKREEDETYAPAKKQAKGQKTSPSPQREKRTTRRKK